MMNIVYLWKVKYILFSDFGNGVNKEEKEGFFVTEKRNLDEIESNRNLSHYQSMEILSAVYLGEGKLCIGE